MKLFNLRHGVAGVGLCMLLAQSAAATNCTYLFDILNPAGSDGAGKIKSISASYQEDGTDFMWSATLAKSPGNRFADGFWLAVSPGPNPKGHPGELALLYFDASAAQPSLTVYGYNGVNGDNSWNNGNGSGGAADKILTSKAGNTSWVKSLTRVVNPNNTVTMSFRIDPTLINGHSPLYPDPNDPYTGVRWGSKIGVWFHTVAGLNTSYGNDGFLTGWSWREQGWYDDSNRTTKCVPEPASIAALGFGSVLIARRRRRNR